MAQMTGAQAMFEMLVREGARYVFGNPGTTELPLMDLFAARNEVEYILALHEDSALGIAAGFADAIGQPAVVNLHTNPGLAHALGNLYNAARAGTPLIVTAGQQDTRSMIEEPLLYADMLRLARQHTKWVWEARHASDVPRAIARAFKIAATPPTGPVFVSLPVNVMEETADLDLPPVTRVGAATRPDPDLIRKAARKILDASNPVIIAGDGAARAGGVPEMVDLAELIGARVHGEPLNALLTFPTGHPLYAGPLFPNAKQTRSQLEGADLILLVGVSNLAPLVYTGAQMLPETSSLVQIDADPYELGKNYPAEIAILASPPQAIRELVEELETLISPAGSDKVNRRREAVTAQIEAVRTKHKEAAAVAPTDGPLPPAYVAGELRAAAPPETVLVDESVTSTAFVRGLFELNEPNTYYYAKGGSLGMGLPMAVGVKMAMPDRPVVCAVGDGSALYSIQALWTAARYKTGVLFVVFNNSSYMILKGGLLAMGGESAKRGIYTGMDIVEPEIDFVLLAESMGVPARRVSRQAELRPALQWGFSATGPALIDVAVQRDVRSVLR